MYLVIKMKLIVGLGNYGKQYENTRHNIGFIVIDYYANKKNIASFEKKGFKSTYIKYDKAFLQKPTTYMNNSGEAIAELMNYYKIDIKDVYVIYDDMDIEVGDIRIRDKGSSGGHNGIKSIISHCGTNFVRIRLGIGNKKDKAISHVLGNFSKEERNILNDNLDTISNLIDDILKDIDLEKLKTKYNKKTKGGL